MPFEFAFAIIAAIIVEADTIPKLPRITVRKKAGKFRILISVINTKRKKITRFREKVSIKLNNSFPKKTPEGSADNFNASEVPVSSSLMNTRASPLIAEKKITIQNNPESTESSTFSSPMENLIIAIVIITNIRSELIT